MTEPSRRRKPLEISRVQFTQATPADAESGLLGFVSCVVHGSLRLDGLALRRTFDRRLALSFPARADNSGRQHPYIRPLNETARREIERQVFAALGFEEGTG